MAPPTSTSTTSSTPFQSQSLPRLKSSFLTTQIRLLGTPLTHSPSPIDKPQQQQQPSSSSSAISSTPPTIPPSTLTTLLDKINKKITAHNRLAYSVESQRHVVEQVDGVYWRDVLRGGVPVEKAETVVGRDVDFLADGDGVPGEWEEVVLGTNLETGDEGKRRARKRRRVEEREQRAGDEDEDDKQEEKEKEQAQAERYAVLHARLRAGVQRRAELRAKAARYKKLKGMLEALGDPKRDVQPNLVTRDNAELEAEMARMRVLLARVGNKIQAGEKSVERVDGEEVGKDQRPADTRRLEAVLGLG